MHSFYCSHTVCIQRMQTQIICTHSPHTHTRVHMHIHMENKSCRFARECVYLRMHADLTTQPELCLYELTQTIANAACRVGILQE